MLEAALWASRGPALPISVQPADRLLLSTQSAVKASFITGTSRNPRTSRPGNAPVG